MLGWYWVGSGWRYGGRRSPLALSALQHAQTRMAGIPAQAMHGSKATIEVGWVCDLGTEHLVVSAWHCRMEERWDQCGIRPGLGWDYGGIGRWDGGGLGWDQCGIRVG